VQGTLKEPNLLAEAGQGLLGAGLSYLRGDMSGVISAGQQLFKKVTTGKSAREKAITTKTSPADVIMFSGCKDNQTSADAVEAVHSPPPSGYFLGLVVRGANGIGTSDGGDELGFP
jgi:metacaspase-1